MQIIDKSIDELIPYCNNSRTHDESQILQIASSIKEFGFTNPVLIDEDNGIIAGHGRVLAARKLGINKVPSIKLSHLTDIQKKAYTIADNKIALNAGWDEELLKNEVEQLIANDFDIDLIGFSDEEIDSLLGEEEESKQGLTDEDDVPEVSEDPITKPGDVWILGNHRLMCGDSTSIDDVNKLINGHCVDMVYTDPPYGVSIVNCGAIGGSKPFGQSSKKGTVGGGKIVKCNKYAPIIGDDSIDIAIEAIQIIKAIGAKVEIIWGGNYFSSALGNSSCWVVWDKENTGNFADAELAWTNQKTAVRIFKHMWNGMIRASEHGQKRVHPTQKPVALALWCFEKYGESSKTILDLFGGSGSTLVACEKVDKISLIMELSPDYCDVIIKRWQDFTGKEAVLESAGLKFNSYIK